MIKSNPVMHSCYEHTPLSLVNQGEVCSSVCHHSRSVIVDSVDQSGVSAGLSFSALKHGLLALFMACSLAMVLSGCASDDEVLDEVEEVTVADPISYEVEGLSGDLLTNVEAHLGSQAVISKKRVRFYVREITEVTSSALRAYGYYHPVINIELPDKEVETDRTVTVKVDAGKPLFIRNCNLEILGEGSRYKIFNNILAESPLKSYHILNHGSYEALKNKIHETALSLGFFDGKFISSRILVYQDQNMADIELIYDSGSRYRFGPLLMDEESERLLLPSKSTQPFSEGEYFASKSVNTFVQSLNQTNYYNTVDVRPATDQLDRTNHIVPLEVHLERRPNNNMRLGAGFSTDEGPRILFEWNKPLLNDRGDSFSSLATITPITQDIQAVYKIPLANPNTDYLTLNAIQTHLDLNDTVSDRSHIAVHYIANQTGSWRRDYSMRVEYEDYEQASEKGYGLNFIPDIRFSRRESSGGFDPSRGYSLELEALGATDWIVGDNTFMQLKATYRGIISITENSRFLFKLMQGANFGPDADDMPPSLRFFAGGDNSVRGFGYRDRAPLQADGSGLKGGKYLTTGTAEVQVPMGIANSRLAFFVDAGMATDDYQDDIMWGPGIGYRFLSPYGIVRVDFAVGLEQDHENNYQLHFAFGPEF